MNARASSSLVLSRLSLAALDGLTRPRAAHASLAPECPKSTFARHHERRLERARWNLAARLDPVGRRHPRPPRRLRLGVVLDPRDHRRAPALAAQHPARPRLRRKPSPRGTPRTRTFRRAATPGGRPRRRRRDRPPAARRAPREASARRRRTRRRCERRTSRPPPGTNAERRLRGRRRGGGRKPPRGRDERGSRVNRPASPRSGGGARTSVLRVFARRRLLSLLRLLRRARRDPDGAERVVDERRGSVVHETRAPALDAVRREVVDEAPRAPPASNIGGPPRTARRATRPARGSRPRARGWPAPRGLRITAARKRSFDAFRSGPSDAVPPRSAPRSTTVAVATSAGARASRRAAAAARRRRRPSGPTSSEREGRTRRARPTTDVAALGPERPPPPPRVEETRGVPLLLADRCDPNRRERERGARADGDAGGELVRELAEDGPPRNPPAPPPMALAGRDRAVMPCITSAKRLAGGNARNAGARNADAIATGLGRVLHARKHPGTSKASPAAGSGKERRPAERRAPRPRPGERGEREQVRPADARVEQTSRRERRNARVRRE